jgi:hypothetical protein
MGTSAVTPASLSNSNNLPIRTRSIKMALRAEAYPTWASTSTSTTADSLLILTTGSVQVILTTQNCPGRLHIHVCIIPCAKLSTANRLIPFSQQATPPPASLSRSSTNTCPPPSVYPTTTIPPGSHSIRPTDSVYSGASARPSTMSHPLQLDTTHMNPAVARAASVSDLADTSVSESRNRRSSDPPTLCLVYAVTVRRSCRIAPGICPPPRLHTLMLVLPYPFSNMSAPRARPTPALIFLTVPVSSPLAHSVPRCLFARRRSPPCTHRTV